MKNAKMLHMLTWLLLVVGGINWLLVGIGDLADMNLNLVYMVVGSIPMADSIVYILVGFAALYEVIVHKKNCRYCGSGGGM